MRSPGLYSFARGVIAQCLAKPDEGGVEAFITRRWGAASSDFIAKAGQGAVTTGTWSNGVTQDREFFETVMKRSLIGRMDVRMVPFLVRMLRMATPTRGYWVGQSKPIPVSKPVIAGSQLPRRKVGAIILATKESMEILNPRGEQLFEEDMLTALVGALDEAFIDASNAGIAEEMPASVTHGAAAIASTGNPASDVAALIAGFAGDLQAAVFVTDPVTAAEIALARDAGGGFAFPDCGPRGGSLIGIPLLTSLGSPRDSNGGQLALVDPTGIASNLEGIEVAKATQGSIEATDSPTGETDTPQSGTTTLISLFQTDTIALRATIHGNWEDQRGGVAVVTGADYGAAS